MEYVHASMAMIALVTGGSQMLRRKGSRPHRLTGRIYVAAMALTALSSFFLTGMTGSFSFLHLLSIWTLVTLVQSWLHLRRGNVVGHAYSMICLYGGLLTAGILAAHRHGLDLPAPILVAVLLLLWLGVFLILSKVRTSRAQSV